jgi:hypothetical protein
MGTRKGKRGQQGEWWLTTTVSATFLCKYDSIKGIEINIFLSVQIFLGVLIYYDRDMVTPFYLSELVFWVVMQCGVEGENKCFGETLFAQSALKMHAGCSSETSVPICKSTRASQPRNTLWIFSMPWEPPIAYNFTRCFVWVRGLGLWYLQKETDWGCLRTGCWGEILI